MNINQAASSQDAETATEMMDAFWRVASSKRSDKRNLQVDNTNLPQKLTINQHQDNRGEHKLIASCLNLRTNKIIRMVWSKKQKLQSSSLSIKAFWWQTLSGAHSGLNRQISRFISFHNLMIHVRLSLPVKKKNKQPTSQQEN